MGGHGIDHVADGEDAHFEGELIFLEPIRVTGAVEVLVVVKCHVGHRPGKLSLFEDLIPAARVGADECPFRITQLPRVGEDLTGYRDLPNVVQQASDIEALESIWIEPQLLSHRPGQLGHLPLVSGGIRISGFHRAGDGLRKPDKGTPKLLLRLYPLAKLLLNLLVQPGVLDGGSGVVGEGAQGLGMSLSEGVRAGAIRDR
jgi:hypothetical protein